MKKAVLSLMEIKKDIAIVSLGKNYDMEKLAEIVAFSRSDVFQHIKYIIVDGSELVSINVMGGEIFFLGGKSQDVSPCVIFCSFSDDVKAIIQLLSDGRIEEIIYVPNIETAHELIVSKKSCSG